MTNREHRRLAKILNAVKGMVAISNYQCDLMDELYPSKRWMKTVAPEGTNHATKGKRVEVLWTNYDVNHGFLKARAKASGNGGHGWLFKDFA